MKQLVKSLALAMLLLSVLTTASAQTITELSSPIAYFVGDGEASLATSPTYQQHNLLLDRHLTLSYTPMVNRRTDRNSTYAAAPLRRILPQGSKGFSGGSASFPVPGPIISGPGSGSGGNDVGGTAGGGFSSDGDRRPGELEPIGDAVVPCIILLLIYALILLVRGEVREEQDNALSQHQQ